MFTKTLLPDTVRAINKIATVPVFQKAYLAGGTALALQVGHRISVDLDFFIREEFNEMAVAGQLQNLETFSLEQASPLTILGRIGETRISLFTYQYKIIEETKEFGRLRLAGKKDLAAMKINALESRGTKRDFVDLFFLAREFSLEEMLKFYDQKYECLDEHLYNIVKSLTYFEDAERNEMPRMIVKVSWNEVKKYFEATALEITKSKIIT